MNSTKQIIKNLETQLQKEYLLMTSKSKTHPNVTLIEAINLKTRNQYHSGYIYGTKNQIVFEDTYQKWLMLLTKLSDLKTLIKNTLTTLAKAYQQINYQPQVLIQLKADFEQQSVLTIQIDDAVFEKLVVGDFVLKRGLDLVLNQRRIQEWLHLWYYQTIVDSFYNFESDYGFKKDLFKNYQDLPKQQMNK